MNNLNKEDLRPLLNQAGQWCLSLYLPTHRTARFSSAAKLGRAFS